MLKKQFTIFLLSLLVFITGCSSVYSRSTATPSNNTSEHIEKKPSKETDDTFKTIGSVVLLGVVLLLSNPKFE